MSSAALFGSFNSAFAVIGAVATFYATFRLLSSVLKNIKQFFLAGPLGLSVNVQRYGKWAVVTGSTDGIGKAYAQELAAKGLNIVLLSRSQDKLKDVAAQIEEKYKVQTKTVAVDFCKGPEIYDGIRDALAGLEIGVLVNNVGMSYSFPQYLCEIADAQNFLPNIININCLSMTMMTHLVLPAMVERKKGIIINVSSAAAISPSPLLTAYSASKAYVDIFSRALNTEYGPKGIIIQSVLPFFVTSKLSKIRRASLTVPSPTSFVRSALATVGSDAQTNGCLIHNLQGWVVATAPEWLVNKVTMMMHLNLRRINLKKLAQKKE